MSRCATCMERAAPDKGANTALRGPLAGIACWVMAVTLAGDLWTLPCCPWLTGHVGLGGRSKLFTEAAIDARDLLFSVDARCQSGTCLRPMDATTRLSATMGCNPRR